MSRNTFFDVEQTPWTCSQGEVGMPILYYDASNIMALFLAPREAVEAELQGTGLVPALVTGQRAVVGLSMYEYRSTSAGPYNEVGLAVPVFNEGEPRPLLSTLDILRSARSRRMGFHILDLPVTTEIANAAGREFWGFPKFVTDIGFSWSEGNFHCSVADPDSGDAIMNFTGRTHPLVPMPAMDLVLYSHLDDQTLRTVINIRHGMSWNFAGGMHLETGTSEHPMAARMRRLGFAEARPFAVLSTPRFQSRLNAGVEVSGRVTAGD